MIARFYDKLHIITYVDNLGLLPIVSFKNDENYRS
jgi:hypothetical protein